MRVIFVPVSDRPECLIALNTAFDVARRTGADVVGCHLRRNRDVNDRVDVSALWPDLRYGEFDFPMEAEADELESVSAAKLFERLADEHGFGIGKAPGSKNDPVAHWSERLGTPEHVMPIVGPTSDLIVVSRPGTKGGRKARVMLMSAVMDSNCPVLVLPQETEPRTRCERIAVAWNRGVSEARTVHALMGLLGKAEEVTLLSVSGGGHGQGPSEREMLQYLERHGVNASHRLVTAGDPGPALVKAAREAGADVLMAGAYSRGRLREMILGGVTEHLLFRTDMPVLLMHS